MEKYIDLHTHSNKSDGSMTPKELIHHAKEMGLSAISLTDHDNTDGVREAVLEGEKTGLEVVPGIELSAKSETETHILGYYIDIENKEFNEKLDIIKKQRIERNYDTERLLNENGICVSIEEASSFAGGVLLGRAHFAKAMVEKGYAESVKDAFDRYLSNGRPCYSHLQNHTAAECVKIINRAGGMAFVAHLHLTRKSDRELFDFLKELKEAGLCGIEGYYTDYTPKMQETYLDMAKELDLLISGGTDFHAEMKPHISIGKGLGNMKIPYSLLENMKEWRNINR